jgi:DNA-binding CsgD family transcriptional regulator
MGAARQLVRQTSEGGNIVKLVRSAQKDSAAEKCLVRLVEDIFHTRSLPELKIQKISGVGSAPEAHWQTAVDAMTSLAQGADRLRAIELAEDVLTNLTSAAEYRSAWVALLVLIMADDLVAADHYCDDLLCRPDWRNTPPAMRMLRLSRARINALAGEPDLARTILLDLMGTDDDFLRPIAASWLADAHLGMKDTKSANTVLNILLGHRASTATPRHGCPGVVFARVTIADAQLSAGRELAALASYLYCGMELRDCHFVNGAVFSWAEKAARVASDVGLTELATSLATRTLESSIKWRSPRKLANSLHLHSQLVNGGAQVEPAAFPRTLSTMANMAEIGVRSALTGNTSPTEPRVPEDDAGAQTGSKRTITLTGSEVTVARLARAGCTNTQIARRLSLAVRTVEFHLSSVYRKLGIANRRELQSSTFLVTGDHQSTRAYRVEVALAT